MVVWYIVFGIFGGVVAGMGMGGGTLLIPLLVIFASVPQSLAQGINLLSFIPSSAIGVFINTKQGLIEGRDLAFIICPAVLTAVGGSFLANVVDGKILTRFFGIFLVLLGVIFLQNTLKNSKENENTREKSDNLQKN